MSITIPLANNVCHITKDQMSNLLHGKDICQFSCLEQFIDFFRHVFTGKSTISEYYQIHHLLSQPKNNPHISEPKSLKLMSSMDIMTEWRPIVGFVKLIDNSKPEAFSQYSVEVKHGANEGYSICMKFAGTVLAEAHCSAEDLKFLNTCLINENNGEIRNDTLDDETEEVGFYVDFRHRLETHLSTYVEDVTRFDTRLSEQAAMEAKQVRNAPADIDRFIEKMKNEGSITHESFKHLKYIGGGSYGTVYLIEEKYVVKLPFNEYGFMIDTRPGMCSNAHPKRVSYYLNLANGDPNFSRHMKIMFGNKEIDVLVSKYINGEAFNIKIDANHERATSLLGEKGLYMHDLHVYGNIQIKDDKLFFVDGDQIVLSKTKRRKRRVSQATARLEEDLLRCYQLYHKKALRGQNPDDKNFFSSLIENLKVLTNTHAESQ